MVEMRERIDRGDQEKEITEAIQVCADADADADTDCQIDGKVTNSEIRPCVTLPRIVHESCRRAFKGRGR
jgi:hypothetical protein